MQSCVVNLQIITLTEPYLHYLDYLFYIFTGLKNRFSTLKFISVYVCYRQKNQKKLSYLYLTALSYSLYLKVTLI
jgi:hypothetical protein